MNEREELIKMITEHPEIIDQVLSALLRLKGQKPLDR